MDGLMAFLTKYIGGFFDWWNDLIGVPNTKVFGKVVNWSGVIFFLLVVTAMVIFLPWY